MYYVLEVGERPLAILFVTQRRDSFDSDTARSSFKSLTFPETEL